FKDLEKVRIAKKGIVGQSTLIGAVTGIVIGAILGFAQGDDPQSYWFRTTAGEKAFAGGVFFGAVGSLTGLIIGMVSHKTFVIHGKRENYEKMREKMRMKLGL
ncbi:MAG TPA: hypothetical protein VNV85_04100, partial [Puia sp.]|nr:hypothetical protein [Puia sp.]